MASIISASTTSATALNLSGDTTGILQLATGATPTTAVTIDASQNVAIGGTTVFGKLSLYAGGVYATSGNMNTGYTILSSTGGPAINIGCYDTGSSSTSYTWLNSGYVNNANAALPIAFATGGTERMRIDSSGNVLVTNPASLGYGTGSGGTVTQATSKGTAVTLNKPTGQITMNNAALAAGAIVTFPFSSTLINVNDVVCVSLANGAGGGGVGGYQIWVSYTQTGAAYMSLKNNTGTSQSDAVIINFAIIKGATA